MPDPRLVSRAQRAATMLERAWERWRTAQGLETEPMPPVSSYVGYSIEEPWGRPRVVFGVNAEDAERLAALLQESVGYGPDGLPRTSDSGYRPPGMGGFAADRPAMPDRGYDQSLFDDVRGRIPVQGWPPEFSESREQLNSAGPSHPGEPELPLDLGPMQADGAAGGLLGVDEEPGRVHDLKPPGELGLSDEFRAADDFLDADEFPDDAFPADERGRDGRPGSFGDDDAPYGAPYAGGAPYGVPFTGEPHYPEGTYGMGPPSGYGPAGGYGVPGEYGAPGGHGGSGGDGGPGEFGPAGEFGARGGGQGAAGGYGATGLYRDTDETADASHGPTGTGEPQEDDGQSGQPAGSLAGDALQGDRRREGAPEESARQEGGPEESARREGGPQEGARREGGPQEGARQGGARQGGGPQEGARQGGGPQEGAWSAVRPQGGAWQEGTPPGDTRDDATAATAEVPVQAVPDDEDTARNGSGPEQFTPGQATPGQASPGQSAPGQSRPAQSRPAQSTPGQFGAGQVTPGQSTSHLSRRDEPGGDAGVRDDSGRDEGVRDESAEDPRDESAEDPTAADDRAADDRAADDRAADDRAGEVRPGDAAAAPRSASDGDTLSRDTRPAETPRYGDGAVPGPRHGSALDGPDWPPSASLRPATGPEAPGHLWPEREAGPTDSSPAGTGEEPSAAAEPGDDTSSGPTAVTDRPADPASRASITDTMAAELAGWAAGELPGQAAARLASWATAGGAVARGRQQGRLGGGGTATERVS